MAIFTLSSSFKRSDERDRPSPEDSPPEPIVRASDGNILTTLKNLWPYMWPADRPSLKLRVLWAFLFMIIAKIATVLVPYLYKMATDALTGEGSGYDWLPAVLVAPVMLVILF